MKLFTTLGFILSLTTVHAAEASGFLCEAEDGYLKAELYQHTQPGMGTRRPAVLVLSNPSNMQGERTLARFLDPHELVGQTGAVYTAFTNYSHSNSREKIAGISLRRIKTLILQVEFSYNEPRPHGSQLYAELYLVLKKGEPVMVPLTCTRYLKNP